MAPSQETKKRDPRKANFLKKIQNGDQATKASSFMKRKPTLKKKAMELETLCGNEVTVICYDANGSVDFWPENQLEVRKRCFNYLGLNPQQKKELNYAGLVESKKKKLMKKKEKKGKIDADTLISSLSNWAGDGDSVGMLETKIKSLKQRIEFLKQRENKIINPDLDHSELLQGTNLISQNDDMNNSCCVAEDLTNMEESVVGDIWDYIDFGCWEFGGQEMGEVSHVDPLDIIHTGEGNSLAVAGQSSYDGCDYLLPQLY